MSVHPRTPDQWREKYLQSLDQQEQQERVYQKQRQSLRRAIVRVSLAAEGLDADLDQVLARLRDRLRSESGDISALLPQLERAILAFDGRRAQRNDQVLAALMALAEQLAALALPRALNKGLRKYRRKLKGRLQKARELPALLTELAQMQQAVMARTQEGQGAKNNQPATKASQSAVSETVESTPSHTELQSSPALTDGATNDQAMLPPTFGHGDETELSANVSAQLTPVLLDLLDKLEQSSDGKETLVLRRRIEQGLQWPDVVPTVEQIRDLVVQTHLAADGDFVAYLDALSQELGDIYAVLEGAAEQDKAQQSAGETLGSHIDTQVASLQQAVASATDVEQLKNQVTNQIEFIRAALKSYRQSIGEGPSVGVLLQSLAQRIKQMESAAEKSQQSFAEQRRKALQDALTALPNRQAYLERSASEFQRWQRYGNPLALAVCDIDHFKRINDGFGHQAGDRVLQMVAKAVSQRLREVDFVARYGGEEFVILLPETDAQGALRSLDVIRDELAQMRFSFRQQPLQVTASFGIAEFAPNDTIETVFTRADRALYQAKAQGRNCCQAV